MARSDNWRINKSSVMAVEGAQILKSLQKVAGAAGLPSKFKLKFASGARMSGIDFDENEVVIGAGRLFTEAPVSADNMDVLVGLTLHEVGHEIIGTSTVTDRMKRIPANSQQEADLFQKFINIGEDIVVESRTLANPNLSDYEKSLHSWASSQMRDADTHKLLELWIEYALGHKAEAMLDLPPEMNEAMAQLVALTGWLRRCCDDRASYPSDRIMAYENYWRTLKDIILNPPKPPEPQKSPDDTGEDKTEGKSDQNQTAEDESTPSSGAETPPSKTPESNEPEPSNEEASKDDGDLHPSAPEPGDDSTPTKSDGMSIPEPVEDEMDIPLAPKPEDSISDELADAIEEATESNSEDVSEQVAEEFSNQGCASIGYNDTVIRSRETKTPLIKPDLNLCKRLERIMTIRKRLQSRIMHGEQYGRIDKRHLHRIGTDQRIFSLKYKYPDGFPNTRILLDLSGSMSGKQADEVLEAAGALQTLVNAEVWCYNYDKNGVNLVRMDEGKLIHQYRPNGNTPSGLALVGVSLGMKRNGLIIHLTDGGHNHGQQPWNAHWILKEHGVELVNIVWGKDSSYHLHEGMNRTKHYDLEGMNCRQIDGLADFPDALYQILIEKVKLSKIGGK